MATDLAQWAHTILKTSTAATDLLVDGADAVLESGELTAKLLDEWTKQRLDDAGLAGRALAIVVVDTGEHKRKDERIATCSVFIYDRGSASPYAPIRALREEVLAALLDQPVTLVRDAYIVSVKHGDRTGHEIEPDFDLDFERVDLFGPVFTSEPDAYG